MIDAWIIEEIRKKEEELREDNRERLELPIPIYEEPPKEDKDDVDRGVIVLQL